MKINKAKVKIGIVGCGAIGARMAKSIQKDFKSICRLTGLYDIDFFKASEFEKSLALKNIKKNTLPDLIKSCDLVVEAVSADNTRAIIEEALKAKKHVLAMSVGKLLNAEDLFSLAEKNKCSILLPSGAIAGIDAIKSASLANIRSITLTTRKPLAGFRNNPYFLKQGINLAQINAETVLFDGGVDRAVELFPQNINVAATISLASKARSKMKIRIITSPEYTRNSHEIEVLGDFGSITTKTDNVVCPDNPKTSYLAVLSGLQTLRQFCTGILIGT